MSDFNYIIIGVTVTLISVILLYKSKSGSSVKESTEKVLNVFDVMKTLGSAVATIGIISTGIMNFSTDNLGASVKDAFSSKSSNVTETKAKETKSDVNKTSATENTDAKNDELKSKDKVSDNSNASNEKSDVKTDTDKNTEANTKADNNSNSDTNTTTNTNSKPSVDSSSFASPSTREKEEPIVVPKTNEEMEAFINSVRKDLKELYIEYVENVAMPVYENRINDFEKAAQVNAEYCKYAEKLYNKVRVVRTDYLNNKDQWSRMKPSDLDNSLSDSSRYALTVYDAIKRMGNAFDYKLRNDQGRYFNDANGALTSLSQIQKAMGVNDKYWQSAYPRINDR